MFLELQRMTGTCPHCAAQLEAEEGGVPVTELATAYTPGALGLFRATGHLVALCGTRWLVRCAKDSQSRMYPSALVPGVRPVTPAAAATQRQGARRG